MITPGPTPIDHVIDFIAGRDPGFPRRIEGAVEAEIDDLAALVGRPLPEPYRAFLTRLGHRRDWLVLGNAMFDIGAITRYHAHGAVPAPEGCLVIGRALGDPRSDFYLWSEREGVDRVVSFPPPQGPGFDPGTAPSVRPVAGGLAQWIGAEAVRMFNAHRLPATRQVASPGIDPGLLPRLNAVLAPLGLEPLWFSNDWCRVYESDEMMVEAIEYPRCPFVASVAAMDAARLAEVLARIMTRENRVR